MDQLPHKIIEKGISRRRFLAGGIAAGLIASTGYAEAQDRKIEIIFAEPHKDKKRISIRFKITDPNPNARYNVRAALQSPQTKDPQPIDVLHNGLEAKDYSMFFSTMGKDGKYSRDGTYYLILGAVTILNGKPFTIQNHVEIRLGEQPQKPEVKQKVTERRIEIIELVYDITHKILSYKFKIISTPALDKPYDVMAHIKPIGKDKWSHGSGYNDIDPKNLELSGGLSLPDEAPGKYTFLIIVTSGNIRIESEQRVIELKSPAKETKAEELKVLVVEVKPKEATIPSRGVPVGTTVDYHFDIKGGEPEFTIEINIISRNKQIEKLNDKGKSNSYGSYKKFNSPGSYTIDISVKDKNGKVGKATILVHVIQQVSQRFAVEFGPFMSAEEAEKVERQVNNAGHQTVRFRQDAGVKLYAILIERVPTAQEAQTLAAYLKEQGGLPAVLLGKEPNLTVRVRKQMELHTAVRLTEQLRAEGHSVRVTAEDAQTFIIRHGNFGSREEAEARGKELARLGLVNKIVKAK